MLKPPDDLGAVGAALWGEVSGAFELDPGEVVLLREACRLTDELERLALALAGAPMVVAGSTGQDRPNPLLDELRKHRSNLVVVVSALRLPVDGESVGRGSASDRGRAAARARWDPSAIERAQRKGGRHGKTA